MNELKPEDVMRVLELKVQRHLMPNVDIDGTVRVEDAERWFLKLLKEQIAPYISALLREKDAAYKELWEERMRIYQDLQEWKAECKKYQDAYNEKDAEIERLQEIADAVADSFPVCEGCKGKTELGERTEDCVYEIDGTFCAQRAMKMWFALRAENEELQKDVEMLESSVQMLREIEISYALQYGTFIDKEICFKKVRAKAITEFFERVCKEVEQTPNANEFFINAWKEKFEEIAKEMKGEAYGEIYL